MVEVGAHKFDRHVDGLLSLIYFHFRFNAILFCFAPYANWINGDALLGIMIESLRSTRLQGCENDKITLHCPRNTHIVVENVFYGKT
jgi:hypothetical protein